MEAAKLTLVELRQLIGAADGALERPRRSFSLFAEGFPTGRVVEIIGNGKTQFVVQFLKENKNLKTAWVEEDLSINPYGLWQQEVDLNQIIFIDSNDSKTTGWTIQQILQSQLFPIVVLSQLKFEEKDLHRFQLFVEKNEGHLILISETFHKSWVPALQIEVSKDDESIQTEVLRRRGS